MKAREMENPGEEGTENPISLEPSYIKVSDSVAMNIPTDTLSAINNIISILQSRGDNRYAFVFKELAEEIINDKDITDDTRHQILDVFHSLSTEIYTINISRDAHALRQAVAQLDTLIPSTTTAWSLWDNVRVLLRSFHAL